MSHTPCPSGILRSGAGRSSREIAELLDNEPILVAPPQVYEGSTNVRLPTPGGSQVASVFGARNAPGTGAQTEWTEHWLFFDLDPFLKHAAVEMDAADPGPADLTAFLGTTWADPVVGYAELNFDYSAPPDVLGPTTPLPRVRTFRLEDAAGTVVGGMMRSVTNAASWKEWWAMFGPPNAYAPPSPGDPITIVPVPVGGSGHFDNVHDFEQAMLAKPGWVSQIQGSPRGEYVALTYDIQPPPPVAT